MDLWGPCFFSFTLEEYWIVDPLENKVTVCVLEGGRYQDRVFVGADRLVSSAFPALDWLAEQILAANLWFVWAFFVVYLAN